MCHHLSVIIGYFLVTIWLLYKSLANRFNLYWNLCKLTGGRSPFVFSLALAIVPQLRLEDNLKAAQFPSPPGKSSPSFLLLSLLFRFLSGVSRRRRRPVATYYYIHAPRQPSRLQHFDQSTLFSLFPSLSTLYIPTDPNSRSNDQRSSQICQIQIWNEFDSIFADD